MDIQLIFGISSLLLSSVYGCSLPRGWKQKSLEDRATLAEIAFYGKVLKSPTRWRFPDLNISPVLEKKDGFYSAKIEIYCLFRGDVLPRQVNISGFGYLPGHCLENHAIEGEKGVFFVRYGSSGELTAHLVNVQKSLAPVTANALLNIIRTVDKFAKKPEVGRNKESSRKKRGGCPILTRFKA